MADTTDAAIWALGRAVEARNKIEERKVAALERRTLVELLGVWSSYRMAGGGAGDQDLVRLAIELDTALTKEISRAK